MTRPEDLDERELGALRRAAAALAGQDGGGVERRVVVGLAAAARRQEISVYATEPVLTVVRPAGRALAGLSAREREVAALIAAGRSNLEIAGELVIAVSTVKDHVHHILEKTGLPNRAAVAAAWRA